MRAVEDLTPSIPGETILELDTPCPSADPIPRLEDGDIGACIGKTERGGETRESCTHDHDPLSAHTGLHTTVLE